MRVEDLHYHLPEGLIAQEPPLERGASRLLVLGRDGRAPMGAAFSEIGLHLPPESLLVVNDAKVTPARLLGLADGKKAELLLLDPPVTGGPGPREAWCLGKPGRRLKPGAALLFEGRGGEALEGKVLEASGARRLVRLDFAAPPASVLERLGRVPLPPYIKRADGPKDKERYQTVYAAAPGAVAAPTAGLHFTEELLAALKAQGHGLAKVTLRVGFGTFAPLAPENLSEGRLHEEWAEVGEEAAEAVNLAKSANRAVVAVGTTTARALEWASHDGPLAPKRGLCSLFIRPGHGFKAIDALITNFHLPGSSLMLLVAALLGRERLLAVYERAVRDGYKFYSYGDAMMIL
jgi:S-adenosylmethionine:tRNA ribosyltransferase-isomerase